MTAPWTCTDPHTPSFIRCNGNCIVAIILKQEDGWKASYALLGMPWRTALCDDLTSAARTCNAGLRLLGLNCDDTLPEPTDG